MITGIDEVGRGCWAGPVVAAAVTLTDGRLIPGLNDSKKLSPARRQQLAKLIEREAAAIGIGWVWPEAVDRLGLTAAVAMAMEQALDKMLEYLGSQMPLGAHDAHEIIIDGNYNFLAHRAGTRTLVAADALVPAASAASIVAKVARDRYMTEVAAAAFPQYGFDRHVGYGTAMHVQRLARYGVSPLHRRTYKPVRQFLLQSTA